MRLPLVALRDMIIFPGVVTPVFVSKKDAVKALDMAYTKDKYVFVTEQLQNVSKRPSFNDIYVFGTMCKVIQTLYLPDGTLKVILEGLCRSRAVDYFESEYFSEVEAEKVVSKDFRTDINIEALRRRILDTFRDYVALESKIPNDILKSIENIGNPEIFTDAVASHSLLKISQKHILLEELSVVERMHRLLVMLMNENELLLLENKIADKVRDEMDNSQKQYYLREQLKVIHSELGDDDVQNEHAALYEAVSNLNIAEEYKNKLNKEISRYSRMPQMSPEASVVRCYLDNVLDTPWAVYEPFVFNLKSTKNVLDGDHYGLKEVKERILEFLAVRKLAADDMKANIICFAGPPGVGKTSLARSIAKALSKKFVNLSLGGMHDEAEIRGHRRTYLGAMPGRIIQKLKQCKVSDPVFLLDEIDKLASDFRGDPASALLEVLDPEQNHSFTDNFIEIPYDLSKVFFITTANDINTIPKPLLDRMEVIKLPGYLPEEKFHIAKEHLIPRLIKEHGLNADSVRFTDSGIKNIIEMYTMEAGVRGLDKEFSKILRKIASEVVDIDTNDDETKKNYVLSARNVKKYLGLPHCYKTAVPVEPVVGVSLGLAWTAAGGDVLLIESASMKGSGKVSYTGNLGDVMKESVQIAVAYLRSNADRYKLNNVDWDKTDLHIHVPEGAVPKDGPSAGITITLSVCSALSGLRISNEIAMTGEMTLHGNVLPIGGVREKILAAKRLSVKRVLIPEANRNDVESLNKWITDDMEITYVRNVSDVIEKALIKEVE